MKHLKRFYYENINPAGGIILDAAQSNHLKNTLRLAVGSEVELFNNYSESYIARISSITANGLVELAIISRRADTALPIPDITLACAIAKGNRMDWLVEKTAELGLARFIPLITARTVVRTGDSSNKMDRWRNLAVAASKQSGRNSILDITPPILFNQLGNSIGGYSLKLIALPGADRFLSEVLAASETAGAEGVPINRDAVYPACGATAQDGKILYLIGPEGDFTPEEIRQSEQWGVVPVRLPVDSVLRVETAAIAMLAMLMYGVRS